MLKCLVKMLAIKMSSVKILSDHLIADALLVTQKTTKTNLVLIMMSVRATPTAATFNQRKCVLMLRCQVECVGLISLRCRVYEKLLDISQFSQVKKSSGTHKGGRILGSKKIDQVDFERFCLARRQMNADDEAGRRGADGSGKSGLITD